MPEVRVDGGAERLASRPAAGTAELEVAEAEAAEWHFRGESADTQTKEV